MAKLTKIIEELQTQFTLKPFMSKSGQKLHFVNFETLDRIDINTCLTAVELNKEVLSRGIAEKTELFVIHHELFSPDSNKMIHGLRRQMIRAIMRHGIIVYSLGNSIIGAENGLSDALAAEFGFSDYIILTFRINNTSLGRIAQLPDISLHDLIETARKMLKPPWIHIVKGGSQNLTKVLILPGTLGIKTLQLALKERIDGIITGEFTYDVARLASEENISLLGVGHIYSKSPGMRNLAMSLAIKFKDMKTDFMPSSGKITIG